MKPYQLYVDQIIYKYFRYDVATSEVEIKNRNAVKGAMDKTDKEELKVVSALYRVNIGKIKERVEYTAKILNVEFSYVWRVFNDFQKLVAQERGLI